MRNSLVPFALLAACVLAERSSAQNYYCDIGSLTPFGVPSDSYAAAAPDPGMWNATPPLLNFEPIFDTNGISNGVELAISDIYCCSTFWSDNALTSGDDQMLIDDFWEPMGDGRLRFRDLPPGVYDVYTYAMAPDSAGFLTRITVDQSPDPAQVVGGDFSAGHQQGTTYALHRDVVIMAGETLVVETDAWQGFPAVNGVQLVRTDNGPVDGVRYCSPAVPNSTGLPGRIEVFGSNAVVDNDITLSVSDLPVNAMGLFLNSQTQGFVPGAGGSVGNLCLGGAIGRYNQSGAFSVGSQGTASQVIDLTNTPTPGGFVSVMVGETWNFQAWYRYQPQLTNFTDALAVTFQ